jgi:hypothetical protein
MSGREVSLRKLCVVVLAICPLVAPSKASASELNYTGMGLHDIVTINGLVSGSYYAGEITWAWSDPVPNGFDPSIATYCVDILNELASPQTVNVSDTTDSNMTTPAADGGAKAAWLLNTYASAVTTGVQAAALQVAIWESLYDNDHNLNTGNFSLVTSSAAYTGAAEALLIYNQANDYLGHLFSASAPNHQYYTSVATWLDAVGPRGGQDQIATPEPATLALLGLGSIGAFSRRRRERARAGN